jgi:hypothetical protein
MSSRLPWLWQNSEGLWYVEVRSEVEETIFIIDTQIFLCPAQAEFEETIEQLAYNYKTAQPEAGILINEVKAWFFLWIKKLQLKDAVDQRVLIVVAHHMMGKEQVWVCTHYIPEKIRF